MQIGKCFPCDPQIKAQKVHKALGSLPASAEAPQVEWSCFSWLSTPKCIKCFKPCYTCRSCRSRHKASKSLKVILQSHTQFTSIRNHTFEQLKYRHTMHKYRDSYNTLTLCTHGRHLRLQILRDSSYSMSDLYGFNMISNKQVVKDCHSPWRVRTPVSQCAFLVAWVVRAGRTFYDFRRHAIAHELLVCTCALRASSKITEVNGLCGRALRTRSCGRVSLQ